MNTPRTRIRQTGFRRIGIASLLAASLLAVPATANAWTGNTFRSPTGNLICKWRGWTGRISCGSYASGTIISMTSNTRPVQGRNLTFGDESSHLLGYGASWATPGRTITCSSSWSGIRCVNKSGWAFLIYRQGVDVSYRGQYLWSI